MSPKFPGRSVDEECVAVQSAIVICHLNECLIFLDGAIVRKERRTHEHAISPVTDFQ